MADAIIARRYGKDQYISTLMMSDIIPTSTTYKIPADTIQVTCIGGEGGGNDEELVEATTKTLTNLNVGEEVDVSIGNGGAVNKAGGTTSFGTYLASNGSSGNINTETNGNDGLVIIQYQSQDQ